MNTYISLLHFTHQGAQAFRESPMRAAAFTAAAKKAGVRVRELFWTVGQYDGAIVFEAQSEEAATSAMLALAALGNVRTQTLRAFNSKEFKAIAAKSPRL